MSFIPSFINQLHPFFRSTSIVVFLFLSIPTVYVYAQPGYIDTTFEGELYSHFGSSKRTNGIVYSTVLLPDGKIMIGGDFSTYNDTPCNKLARLNTDGSLDTTFHSPNVFNTVMAIALVADNKLLIAGVGTFGVIRLFPNGEVDASFEWNVQGNFSFVRTMVVQSDQKIILGGQIYDYAGITQNDLLRLNPNGTIDTTFNIDGGPYYSYNSIYSLALQSDGKILAGGDFTSFDSIPSGNIVRLNSDGSVDLTFNTGSGMNNIVTSIAVQPSGKIIATGLFSQFNGTSKYGIVSLLPNGSLNPEFSTGSGAPNVHAVALKPNGNIVIGGDFVGYDSQSTGSVVILDSTGILLSSPNYGSGGTVLALLIQSDDKLIVCGDMTIHIDGSNALGIGRSMPNGDLDSAFVPWTGTGNVIYDLEILPNNKMIIGGNFDAFDGHLINKLARLNEDGTLDLTFTISSGPNGLVKSIAIQTDGKIIIGGDFTSYNGIIKNKITRLNSDGSIDLTFNMGSGIGFGNVKVIEIQPNGKILVGGSFYQYNGAPCNGLIRLNQNGTLDPTYNTGVSGSMSSVSTMALQPDGKIIVSGSYYNNTQVGANPTMRLLPDGALDATYNPDTYIPFGVNIIKLQADNKILIGGGLASNSINIIRLNSDGTPDLTFAPGGGTDYPIFDILPLSNGQMIIAGEFVHYDGQTTSCLVRVNANGTLDNTFHSQNYPYYSPTVKVIKTLSNGQLLIAGDFDSYDQKPAHSIMRLNHDLPESITMEVVFDAINPVTCGQTGSITAVPINGALPYTYSWQTLTIVTEQTIQPEQAGLYTVIVTDSMGQIDQKSILLPGYETIGMNLSSYLVNGEFRPGFISNLLIEPINSGCIPTDAQLKLVLPELLSYNSASPAPSFISGDTLMWDFPQLVYSPNPTRITVSVTTSTTAMIGDSIHLVTLLTPIAGDDDPLDNLNVYTLPIVNAFDPNFISVYPQGKCDEHFIANDQTLTYTAHFQNTGNSEAVNVNVLDTLDPSLNIATVRVIDQSHPVWTEVLPGNVLNFHFDNIHLVDSASNEQESHGYVIFETRPLSNLNQGTTIINSVGIYFDFNPVVVTNNVFNTVFSGDLESYDCNLGISTIATNDVQIFPNPFVNGFTINRSTEAYCEITLTDLQGKIAIQTFRTSEKTIVLKGDQLQNGIYLLRIRTESSDNFVKIVKE